MNTPGISREFSTGELLRFAAPSIVMMLFLSMYTIVDGFFISRYVGTAALSATNIDVYKRQARQGQREQRAQQGSHSFSFPWSHRVRSSS